MKYFLTTTLVFIYLFTLTISVNAAGSPRIIIRNEEELSELRIMSEANDEELKNYLERKHYNDNGLYDREDVVDFLQLLDSLPIPYEEGMVFSSLTYYPDSTNKTINIHFNSETGQIYSFRLFTGGDRGRSLFERHGEPLVETYRSQDNKIIIYYPLEAWGSFPNANGIYYFPMEINGYLIRAIYNPNNRNITDVTPENIYGRMTVVSLRDVTWIERHIKGDVTGDGRVTTADALEILKYVAGMRSLIVGDDARAAADVNGDGKIDTADALEVLRIVAGLA
ncbi:MAG: dockerin type I repeat-containing protein [Oscillospiraceae bacterium]|jgi:hypothetical protein|nr:dockerin type I repeat-containing protein [Oscillospiraceae bacterium]